MGLAPTNGCSADSCVSYFTTAPCKKLLCNFNVSFCEAKYYVSNLTIRLVHGQAKQRILSKEYEAIKTRAYWK